MRSAKPKYGGQPSHRDGQHPLAQSMRFVRTWLLNGPLAHRDLESLASERGLNSARLAETLAALGARGEITATPTRIYSLVGVVK
ncbi:hypothetical protein [[Mycobacterium] zoologicum]|uniref:hypothetical protein n=1 Tax=[Mycobacterium] zoologicum TaxID=2872311 RepID=UPI001CDAD688|nr:hypothetical protein [Mycolicibacter sp. MYC101]MEB3065395.1 hypothetical protein [Mycolicibacter sp. MYC101]